MTYRRVRWEERPGHSVEVGEGELDAGVGEPQLVYVGGGVSGADVTLAGEWGDRDGVFQLVLREVVRDSSVHVSLREKHTKVRTSSIVWIFLRTVLIQVTSPPEWRHVCFCLRY